MITFEPTNPGRPGTPIVLQPFLQPNWRKTWHRLGLPVEVLDAFEVARDNLEPLGACWECVWTVFKTVARPAFLVEGGFDSHAPPPRSLSSDSAQNGFCQSSR